MTPPSPLDIVSRLGRDRAADLAPGTPEALLASEPDLAPALEETLAALRAPAAATSLAADPYWPKWDSPWWRLLLLVELGHGSRIPRDAAANFARAVDAHYLRTFPVHEGELPPGKDGQRDVLCFCAVGGALSIALAAGLDAPAALPWLPAFVDRHRLTDGGLNCDDEAHRRAAPCSSIESTVAAAEPFLALEGDARVPFAAAVVDGAARYVTARAAATSLRKRGAPMFRGITTPVFPRFYAYDAARGLRFLSRWAHLRRSPLDLGPLVATITSVDSALHPGRAGAAPVDPAPRPSHALARTIRQDAGGAWVREPAAGTFPLLEVAARPRVALARLRSEWAETLADLTRAAVA